MFTNLHLYQFSIFHYNTPSTWCTWFDLEITIEDRWGRRTSWIEGGVMRWQAETVGMLFKIYNYKIRDKCCITFLLILLSNNELFMSFSLSERSFSSTIKSSDLNKTNSPKDRKSSIWTMAWWIRYSSNPFQLSRKTFILFFSVVYLFTKLIYVINKLLKYLNSLQPKHGKI